MKKLTGNINIGVFISGRGSNLKELIKFIMFSRIYENFIKRIY